MCEETRGVGTSNKQHCIRKQPDTLQHITARKHRWITDPGSPTLDTAQPCVPWLTCHSQQHILIPWLSGLPRFPETVTQWHRPFWIPHLTTLTGLAPRHAMPPCRPPQPAGVQPARHPRWQPPWHWSSPPPSCCAVQAHLRGRLEVTVGAQWLTVDVSIQTQLTGEQE